MVDDANTIIVAGAKEELETILERLQNLAKSLNDEYEIFTIYDDDDESDEAVASREEQEEIANHLESCELAVAGVKEAIKNLDDML
jgi:hypothetical protein